MKILTFLLLYNCLSLVFSNNFCPPKCQCVKSSVKCYHQELIDIPTVPATTHALDVRFNKIFDIAPGVFANLNILRLLLLNDNKLTALRSGSFYGLIKLKYLYLYRNHIQTIEPDVFQGMDHLEQLYLDANEIHQIDAETFTKMPKLERLYLHNNKIERIPFGSFKGLSSLRKLRLDNNNLICDCSMKWLAKMVKEHSEINVAAICQAPKDKIGVPLTFLREDDFYCIHPEIKRDPEDTVVDFGDNALFNCIATGEPQPDIVWLRDSVALPLDATRYEIMDNGTLMVHNADETDVGTFECMAKNPAGEAVSKPAKIVLQRKSNDYDFPIFVEFPKDEVAKMNDSSITFNCVVKGIPVPHIYWYFNNERVLLDERTTIQKNGSLKIENIQENDAGIYSCHAINIHGKKVASAELKVKMLPVFLTVPKDKSAYIGDNVEFICTAKGSPKPILTWFRNTLILPPGENVFITDANQNLTIININKEDEGLYHCRAENSEGINEISALLTVEDFKSVPPKIVFKLEDTDAYKGSSVQLPCETESEIPTSIEWRKDGSHLNLTNTRTSISYIGSLIINNLTTTDTGLYECYVYNDFGRDTASAYLNVKNHVLPGDEYVNIALTEATRDIDQAITKTIENMFNNTQTNTSVHDLFKLTQYPNEPEREVARAAEIYERTLDKLKGYIDIGLNVTSAQPFNYRNVLSVQHLDLIARLSGCTAHRESRDCSDICYHNKYRSIDGSCNNINNPLWGASLTGFRRIMYPVYENGFSQPTGWNKGVKYNGFELPSARLVSTSIITTNNTSQDNVLTHMVMQWGQWLDHDLDHALPSVSSVTWDGVDCKKTCDYAPPCFPIDVPANDTRISNRRCIDFIRTSSVCGSGMTSVLFGRLQPREQINQLTSYLDASQVYGFEKSVAEDLRDLSNDNGLLRVGAIFPGKKPLLPTIGINGMDCRLNLEESTRNCFVAGDIRANEQIGLAAMHTIWMREHNRLAMRLKVLNPFWDGHRVYQESRKIVYAQMQYITYFNWLPLVLGPEGYIELKEYQGYNSDLDSSISNVFATAALRFGHSMINPILHRYDENFEEIPQGHLQLRHAFFAPWRLVDEGGVDPLIRGMFMTPAKLKTPKQNLNSELTEKLFYSVHAVALDLAAINIQRSRDHAIPPYTKWRQYCNMPEVDSFDDLANEISDASVRQKLQELYGSVHNIDVWVGGILEDQVKNGKVGPLFRCLLIEQFRRTRAGDRFWFENPTTFKPEQLEQIMKTNLAKVLCDNGDNIDTITENIFLLPDIQGGLIDCADLPSMDLRSWADCETCHYDEVNSVYDSVTISKRNTNKNDESNIKIIKNLEQKHDNLVSEVHILNKRLALLEGTIKSNN